MNRSLLLVIYFLSLGICSAQESEVKLKIEQLEAQREEVIAEEKAALKRAVEEINARLDRKEIDWEEAEELKSEAAKKHALNIENRIAIIENQLALLRREQPEKKWQWSLETSEERDEEDYKSRYSRTSTHLVIAAGLNNALRDGQSPEESDFKIGGSRFFEIGLSWRTRVFEESNWLRLRYGFSFQFNGLKPTDNRYFVEEQENTLLERYPVALEKSKFRTDNLVFPVYFEIGPSKKIESARSIWFSSAEQFRIGLGGYAGFNIGERQKLKFEEDGENVKKKLKGSYNTEDFVYGLSAYAGWGGTSLYLKYDLNKLFEAPNPELHNISAGMRFDLN